MANGKLTLGKQSGGVTTVTVVDGVDNTNLVLPESGTVATLSNIHGFKNLIINGRKQVNQSGLTTTDNAYNYDNHYKVGNNWFNFIDGKNIVSGESYTLSWDGVATAGYYIGTAGALTINAQTFIPIANGETITPTITSSQILWIKFASDATGSTYNSVQFEPGTAPTPYEQRLYALEEILCQRYFWIIPQDYLRVHGYGLAGNGFSDTFKLPVTMAKIPILDLGTPTGGNLSNMGGHASPNCISVTYTVVSTGIYVGEWASAGMYVDARPY